MTRRSMNHVSSFVLGWAALTAASHRALAGPVPRLAHTLYGTVVGVDATSRSLTVRARRLEAWMSAIVTIYRVDNEKLMREVKAGYQIMGKVFDGETALRDVKIVAVTMPPVTQVSRW